VPIVLKSGSPNLLEPSGPVQAFNGIALPFIIVNTVVIIIIIIITFIVTNMFINTAINMYVVFINVFSY